MPTEVAYTDEFGEWWSTLDVTDKETVARKVTLLEMAGPALGRPATGQLVGSKHGCRELIVQSKGRPIRVAYNFNPDREGILLIGGDKTGKTRFYEEFIPRADKIWAEYLKEFKARKASEKKQEK